MSVNRQHFFIFFFPSSFLGLLKRVVVILQDIYIYIDIDEDVFDVTYLPVRQEEEDGIL